MSLPKSYSLDVPGARLYYEVQGTGPALMVIGHPMGVAGFAPIARLLADQFTVVSYDPRGFGRSTIDDREQDAEPEVLADDVGRVLDAIGGGPAHVLGSSGGAVTGLALVARSPSHVRTLVAHEPPLALLLPDADEALAGVNEVYEAYRKSGIAAAWAQFSTLTGMALPPQQRDAPSQPSPEAVATSERFFAHGLLPIALYEPDLSALLGGPSRVVVAGGSTSRGEFAHRTATALAERLGSSLIEFPGGHAGFVSDAEEFATALRGTLD